MARKEPYEAQAKYIVLAGIFVAAAAFFLGAGYWAAAVFFLFALGAQIYPMLMNTCRLKSKAKVTIETLGTFSALTPVVIPVSADGESSPGKVLVSWGGGGPYWAISWPDGGRPYARGGYITVPRGMVIELGDRNHLYLPVIPMRVPKGLYGYPPHVQAIIEEHGYHTDYTDFYDADYGVVSLIPPSRTVLDREALDKSVQAVQSDYRDLTSEAVGFHATQMDLWSKARDVVEPKRKRSLFGGRPEEPKDETQEQDGN